MIFEDLYDGTASQIIYHGVLFSHRWQRIALAAHCEHSAMSAADNAIRGAARREVRRDGCIDSIDWHYDNVNPCSRCKFHNCLCCWPKASFKTSVPAQR